MNLYFLDKNDKQHLVKKDVDPGYCGEGITPIVLDDLKTRKPDLTSNYQRTWWDKFSRLWIDFGSHTEFYICQDEKYAMKVVDDEKGEHTCNEDYCEI